MAGFALILIGLAIAIFTGGIGLPIGLVFMGLGALAMMAEEETA